MAMNKYLVEFLGTTFFLYVIVQQQRSQGRTPGTGPALRGRTLGTDPGLVYYVIV